MDIHFQYRGTTFVWNAAKASSNLNKHGVSFEEAATVFDDPLLVVQDASRNDQPRDAVIGFDVHTRLLFVVYVEIQESGLRIVSARRATRREEAIYAR
ncbi:BrnT family toxin [Halomonas sp. NO4]|uniref:BrnT family toxin n=1 Tax=Halomonas sp. NO4 TaxID=2484813 RepID=UPI0013D4E50F|nr:BrnT family toxin [Halomonas sp. NO4]